MKTSHHILSGFCLFALLASLPSCKKNNAKPVSDIPETAPSEEFNETARASSFRGVYVDNFLNVLGRPSGEDSLLNWCLKNRLNAISLYNAASIVATPPTAALLNTFIGKANSDPYNIDVALVATNITIATNQYTRYYKQYPNKFSAMTSEYEFWNNGKSYTTFKGQLDYMKAIHDSTSGVLKRQVYFSQFEDAEGVEMSEDAIAQKMVSSSDKLFLVNYVADSYNLTSTTLDKIEKIAAASYALNKTLEIVILFNVNANSVDPSLYDYFSVTSGNHPFMDAYAKFKADYDKVNFAHKSSVRLIGYQLYKYSAAVSARPEL